MKTETENRNKLTIATAMEQEAVKMNGVSFVRIKNDANGNPRYIFHFLELSKDYNEACRIASKFGGRKYRAKWYGGGIVCQSYDLADLAQSILANRIAMGRNSVG